MLCFGPRKLMKLVLRANRLNGPVPTQCLQSKKLQSDRGLDQYCANVSMKINAKLGGINVSIPLPELVSRRRACMIDFQT
jgi:eukaryotic translation initiation factor 2C